MIILQGATILVIGAKIQCRNQAYFQPGEATAFYHPTQIPWPFVLLIYKKETTERRTFLRHLSAVPLYSALASSWHAFCESGE